MGFLDSVKGFAEKVGDSVEKGAKSVSDSSKKMQEKSRIKKEISNLEAEVNASYFAIGKKYFELNSTAPGQDYAESVENIVKSVVKTLHKCFLCFRTVWLNTKSSRGNIIRSNL